MKYLAWLTIPTFLATAGSAVAATVYSQPGSAACDSCWTSAYGNGSGYRAYDNFTLAGDATITSVSWQGIYIPNPGTGTAPAPNTDYWEIGFFADVYNFPGNLPVDEEYVTTLAASDVTTTLIGTGTFGSDAVNLYSFTAVLPVAFTVLANTPTWFSPLSLASSFDPFFSWSSATAIYDNLTAQTDTSGGTYDRNGDRAFSLSTAGTVPEPASWALMIAGFALTGGALRRRAVAIA